MPPPPPAEGRSRGRGKETNGDSNGSPEDEPQQQQNAMEAEEEEEDFEMEEGGVMIGDVYVPPPPPKPMFSGDETGRRLIITHITNINFKSYAGTTVLGPFHKSFTSIVGPNGSGKSNVIDSMLFVFGYRATKLRLKKLSSLIHNSDTFPDLDSCEVRVHFAILDDRGGEDHDLVPGSDFIVSRTANKDNSSSYYIQSPSSNRQKKVKFNEISQLLQSHGIDLRYNRFLILQGEVEQIALMKPKAESENEVGMLEFLEDIIGSNRLKVPLEKLQERVDQMNELRSEKMNRVKAIEKEKDALEGPRNEAIKYIRVENDIAQHKNKMFQFLQLKDVEKRDSALEAFKETEAKHTEAMKKVDELQEEKKKHLEDLKDKQVAFTQHMSLADKCKKDYEEMERRDIQCGEKIKHTKTKGKNLYAELEKEEAKLESLKDVPSSLTDDIELLAGRKETLEKSKQTAEEDLDRVRHEIKKDTEVLSAEKDSMEQELLSLEKGVNEAKSKMELDQSEFDIYVHKQKKERAKLEQLNFKLSTNQREIGEKKTALARFKGDIPKMEKEVDSLHKQTHTKTRERSELTQQVQQLRGRENDIKTKVNQRKTGNKTLSALMDANRKGKLKGILGRLGDLGTIDPKFDVAISTSCGRLENIVTETVEDAMAAVSYLKETNAGRATFIILEKVQSNEGSWESWRGSPEDCPRLFDLVVPNEDRFKVAFYFSLWDTIVCKDLDQGTRVTDKKRLRVVTLDGKLIETSGAMSGGGRPSKGRMKLSTRRSSVGTGDDEGFSESALKDVQEQISQKQFRLEQLDDELRGIQHKQESLNIEMATMKGNAPKLEMEIQSREEQLDIIKKNIAESEKTVQESTPDQNVVKELDKKVEASKKAYSKVKAKAREIEEKIEEVNSQIKQVVDKTLGSAKKKLDKIKSELNSVNSDLSKKSAAQKTAERNIEKSQTKIDELNAECQASQQLIADLKKEKKDLEEKATETQRLLGEVNQTRATFDQELGEIRGKIGQIEAKETKLASDNLELTNEVEKLSKLLQQREDEVKRWVEKLSSLELQFLPDEDIMEGGDEGERQTASSFPIYSKEDLSETDGNQLRSLLQESEEELKQMKPNMAAIEEYKKKVELYLSRTKELTEVTEQRDMFKSQYDSIRTQRLSEFKEGFLIITNKLKQMYRMITAGGDADLEWADSLDPFSEGVNFTVRPNKKSWKKISNLSGGEKTLSSLSLIFALRKCVSVGSRIP